MQLPDDPAVDLRAKKETSEPQGSIELLTDGVGPFEVVADVQDDLASPRCLHQTDEHSELLLDLRRTGSGAAVACQLEIDGGRESHTLGWSDIEEVTSLVVAGCAQVK